MHSINWSSYYTACIVLQCKCMMLMINTYTSQLCTVVRFVPLGGSKTACHVMEATAATLAAIARVLLPQLTREVRKLAATAGIRAHMMAVLLGCRNFHHTLHYMEAPAHQKTRHTGVDRIFSTIYLFWRTFQRTCPRKESHMGSLNEHLKRHAKKERLIYNHFCGTATD